MTAGEVREVAWRESGRAVRVWVCDARLLVLVVPWMFWPAWWTTAVLAGAVLVLRFAEARGYGFAAAGRSVRGWMAGRRRALHRAGYRRAVDFG